MKRKYDVYRVVYISCSVAQLNGRIFVKTAAKVLKMDAQTVRLLLRQNDGLAGIIEEYLKDKERICARQVWHNALKESTEPPKWKVSNINSIIEKIPGWKRLKSPARFAEYGMQRGFEKMSTNKSDFVTVSDEELKEMPFN